MIYDLTPYVNNEDYTPVEIEKSNEVEFYISVDKKVYDEIRCHDGEFLINNRVYNISQFDTNYIGMGEDYQFHIIILMIETEWSIRNNKLNNLGI